MKNASEDEMLVVTNPIASGESPNRGAVNRGVREVYESVSGEVKLPVEILKANFESFFGHVMNIVSIVSDRQLPYHVDEIEISAEVSGEGKIQLIGAVSAGAKGGITLRLKRTSPSTA